jgi:hypothetical protein
MAINTAIGVLFSVDIGSIDEAGKQLRADVGLSVGNAFTPVIRINFPLSFGEGGYVDLNIDTLEKICLCKCEAFWYLNPVKSVRYPVKNNFNCMIGPLLFLKVGYFNGRHVIVLERKSFGIGVGGNKYLICREFVFNSDQ